MPKIDSINKLFKPDFTPKQLKTMGVHDELYNKTKPRLASLSKWPKRWIHSKDPKGWLQWYERYKSGRRISDDVRQIKRWRGFKARHLSQFIKNPTPRRYFALRNWAINGMNHIPKAKQNLFKIKLDTYVKKFNKST